MSRKNTRTTVYLNFVLYASLGLPDAIFGSAWPIIHTELHLNIELISAVTAVALLFSLLANFIYIKLTKIKIAHFLIFALSCLVFGIFLVLIASNRYLLFASIPFIGLGQGAVDVAVNSFVAARYSSRVMNVVHAFFGLGVTVSSVLVSLSIALSNHYRLAMLVVLLLQLAILAAFLPHRHLFRKKKKRARAGRAPIKLKVRNFLFPLFSFVYSVEQAAGIFLASYMVFRGSSASFAALITSLFWLAIMIGRISTVHISPYVKPQLLIYAHYGLAILGGILFFFYPSVAVLVLAYGLAPLYPNLMELPYSFFGYAKAARIVGLNVFAATLGILIIPIFYSLILQFTSLSDLPFLILINLIIMVVVGILAVQLNRKGS